MEKDTQDNVREILKQLRRDAFRDGQLGTSYSGIVETAHKAILAEIERVISPDEPITNREDIARNELRKEIRERAGL